MPDFPGNAPVAENFADRIPTADGMTILFGESQFDYVRAESDDRAVVPLIDVLAPDISPSRKAETGARPRRHRTTARSCSVLRPR